MNDYQSVFSRKEIKYLISSSQETALLNQINEFLCKDLYCESTISNLYFDTEDYYLIRSSIEKPLYKEKLRLRSYEVPTHSSNVFVELKKKLDGTVYKRRISLPYRDAVSYLSGDPSDLPSTQIRKEVDWFLERYPLSPKAFICYDRKAFKGKMDCGLRITFDRNILFRSNFLDLSSGNFGQNLLGPNQALMEIKMSRSMPLWLSASLNSLSIYPCSYSKYGNSYKSFILNSEINREGGVQIA